MYRYRNISNSEKLLLLYAYVYDSISKANSSMFTKSPNAILNTGLGMEWNRVGLSCTYVVVFICKVLCETVSFFFDKVTILSYIVYIILLTLPDYNKYLSFQFKKSPLAKGRHIEPINSRGGGGYIFLCVSSLSLLCMFFFFFQYLYIHS